LMFLMREEARNGGKCNGHLKAPHRQLAAFGIAKNLTATAIHELEAAGLIKVHPHGMRAATTYRLAWLPEVATPSPRPKPGQRPARRTANAHASKSVPTTGDR